MRISVLLVAVCVTSVHAWGDGATRRPTDFERLELPLICEKSKTCPDVPKFQTPVCGTDNVTYSTLCALLATICEEESTELGVQHPGACGESVNREAPVGGRGGKPLFVGKRPDGGVSGNRTSGGVGGGNRQGERFGRGKLRESDSELPDILVNGEELEGGHRNRSCKRERCPERTLEGPEICGSDNVTYANLCEFRKAKCDDIFLTIAKEGECTEDQGNPDEYCVKCPFTHWGPHHHNRTRPRDQGQTEEPLDEAEAEVGHEDRGGRGKPAKEEREGVKPTRKLDRQGSHERGNENRREGRAAEDEPKRKRTHDKDGGERIRQWDGEIRRGSTHDGKRLNDNRPSGKKLNGNTSDGKRRNTTRHDGERSHGNKRNRDEHHRKHHQPPPPVCGNDSVTYDSLCELKRTACLLREFDLQVESPGPCATTEPLVEEYP